MPAKRAVTVGRQRIALTCTAATAVCVCVLAHACARVRAHACVRDVFAIYDNIAPGNGDKCAPLK